LAELRSAKTEGLECFDFMAPAAGYEENWADVAIRVSDFVIPVTLIGRLYDKVYLESLRPHLVQMARSGPLPVKTALAFAVRALTPGYTTRANP
jgi:CelD/BcsL family acetyltransferase involved in cellulose biosynthesis